MEREQCESDTGTEPEGQGLRGRERLLNQFKWLRFLILAPLVEGLLCARHSAEPSACRVLFTPCKDPCSAVADTGTQKLSELLGCCMECNQLRAEHPSLLVSY